jgi:hypothetical protein
MAAASRMTIMPGGWLKPAFAQVYRVLKQDSFCVSFYGWRQTANIAELADWGHLQEGVDPTATLA